MLIFVILTKQENNETFLKVIKKKFQFYKRFIIVKGFKNSLEYFQSKKYKI